MNLQKNSIKLALIQIDIEDGKVEDNLNKVLKEVKQTLEKNKHIDAVVLPEMWNTGYDLKNLDKIADNMGNPCIENLRELARNFGVNIIAGSIADKRKVEGKTKVYNSSYIIDRRGEIIARYDKVHLFRLMKEDKFLTAGEKMATFELDGIKCGIVICYDLRFPEFIRKIALEDIKILFVPAQWPLPRDKHWRLLNIVRAIENQIYVVGVNRAGRQGNVIFPGASLVVDPWGEVEVELDDKEAVICHSLSLNKIEKIRRYMPVYDDRRPDIY
ncbi:carbon-nitrogen family hydrolase [Thermovenabulum gondwanense]|uniref:2-oxoglutaramate amidase n=1 Tax=Thermovenabulum gondwanense TaxID=520767 RepID=A0A162ML06_9FIRM|nr:carbon-nitrogen family hydrolase [Thermovenabulum gondwanense]KYO66527.1 2-oxoglutaramate amidase [Thermovenabulum gondwanense]